MKRRIFQGEVATSTQTAGKEERVCLLSTVKSSQNVRWKLLDCGTKFNLRGREDKDLS